MQRFLGFGLLAMVAWVGCGSRVELVPVRGKVVYRGQPLEFGGVMFQPLAGGQPAQSKIAADGTFALFTHHPGDGARPGENKVRISCYEAQRPAAPNDAASGGFKEMALGKSLIPERYTDFDTSGLTVNVQAGLSEPIVFELSEP